MSGTSGSAGGRAARVLALAAVAARAARRRTPGSRQKARNEPGRKTFSFHG